MIGGSAAMIFTRLGHYALWDDEANTALFAKSVWRTGDATAVVGHNIVAHTGGAELRGLRNRSIPPLGYYLAAPFVGLLGDTALAARLPFAICGVLTVAFLAYWLWRDGVDVHTWVLMAIAVVGNVSLMLYSRQARWYALSILLSVVLAWLYLHWDGRTRGVVLFAFVSVCLLAASYLNYAALCACLLVDCLVRGRKVRHISWRQWVILLAPQVLLGGLVLLRWNPWITTPTYAGIDPWVRSPGVFHIHEKAHVLWWYLRDMNKWEYGVGALIVLSPLLYFVTRNRWLVYGPLAMAVYVAVTVVFAPHQRGARFGQLRYVAPLLVLCMYVGASAVRAVGAAGAGAIGALVRRPGAVRAWWLTVPLAVAAFTTNLLHGGPLLASGLRCTPAKYVGELVSPPPDPNRAAAEWVNRNVAAGRSILVKPAFRMYPLMFHAPKAVYAWQLEYPPAEQFRSLGAIHFECVVPPDYIVAFGPFMGLTVETIRKWEKAGVRYEGAAIIDVCWREVARPELDAHIFETITDYDRLTEAIYVLRRVSPPLGARISAVSKPSGALAASGAACCRQEAL